MKKLVSLFMVCAIVLGLGAPLSAATDMEKPPLSEQSDAEILAFLEEYNIERVGQSVKWSDESMAGFAREVIEETELYGHYTVTRGDTTYWKLGDAIEAAVIQYYGLQGTPPSYFLNRIGERSIAGFLVDSDFYKYDSAMASYNCYSYAIDKTDDVYDPGDFSGKYLDLGTMNAESLAKFVQADLKSNLLNKQCVKITDEFTEKSNLVRGQSAICVRKGVCVRGRDIGKLDYHFMKYIPSEKVWRHKPGSSGILTYKYWADDTRIWTNEYMTYDWLDYDTEYTGDVYYIIYKSSHYGVTGGTYTGNNYHRGNLHYCEYIYNCKDCGAYTEWRSYACSGNPCVLPQSLGDEYAES